VGFIQKTSCGFGSGIPRYPEEIAEADLLLHVVDITHVNAQAQSGGRSSDIGGESKPVTYPF